MAIVECESTPLPLFCYHTQIHNRYHLFSFQNLLHILEALVDLLFHMAGHQLHQESVSFTFPSLESVSTSPFRVIFLTAWLFALNSSNRFHFLSPQVDKKIRPSIVDNGRRPQVIYFFMMLLLCICVLMLLTVQHL